MFDLNDTIATRWARYQPSASASPGSKETRYAAFAYGGPNIGDDIQTLAAIGYLPEDPYYMYRDAPFAVADKEPAFLIANGWYLHWVNRFITPPNIVPLYTSVHFRNPRALTRAAVQHLKKHEPIGCRDIPTLKLLLQRGIDAYFSGCLTMTLERPSMYRNDNVVISDLQSEFHELVPTKLSKDAIRTTHNTDIGIVPELSANYEQSPWEHLLQVGDLSMQTVLASMYPALRCRLSPLRTDILPDSRVLSARHTVARSLLRQFSEARLVITSRLHCALPCLAFGTPVVMLHRYANDPRFAGINRYLRIYGAESTQSNINWAPDPVDIAELALPLKEFVTEAVRIRRNPLRATDSSKLS